MLTILASFAQEESRSVSENVKWRIRKRFEQGEVVNWRFMFGYCIKNGKVEIEPKEAEVVRSVFQDYINGVNTVDIARRLQKEGIPRVFGGKWTVNRVIEMIRNEKYKGDVILQKSFTVDFLTKKTKSNEGEVPQYYVENSHPAIIEPDVFDMVQYEMKKRKESKGHHSGASCFSSKIVCGECGSFYGSKVWHSTSKYRRTIWQCNHKFKGDKCSTPHFDEATLKQLFVDAFNQLITNKDEITENCRLIKQVLTDTSELDREINKLHSEIEIVSEMIRQCIEENAHSAMDQEEYEKRYEGLVSRYEKAKDRLEKVEEQCQGRHVKQKKLETFISVLLKKDIIISEFDEDLWHVTWRY